MRGRPVCTGAEADIELYIGRDDVGDARVDQQRRRTAGVSRILKAGVDEGLHARGRQESQRDGERQGRKAASIFCFIPRKSDVGIQRKL
jgi:hypothetical protein